MTPRTYAIDYDGTWTSDPQAFQSFARLLRTRGHRVILVTQRTCGHSEVQAAAGPFVDRVVFAPFQRKRRATATAGESVDVWIDDHPQYVDAVRPG